MPGAGTVYILASRRNGTLYTGVTNDLIHRVWNHKHDMHEGFTRQYQVHRLVYFEEHQDIRDALFREKQIKKGMPGSVGAVVAIVAVSVMSFALC